MNARVSVADVARTILPRDCPDGWLVMLRAYFDDSGTHDSSSVVVMAGVIGTESEMLSLEALWKEHLDAPLCGRKEPLTKTHMYDCYGSTGEFLGWKRTETDYFRHQLREAIIKSRVSAYCVGCIRKDWDELMQGDIRGTHGNAEGYAIRQCFIRAIKWANENSFDPQISFIFDDTGRLEREVRAVFHAFQLATQEPEIVGLSYLSSKKFIPLQAADLIAWEYYRHCREMAEKGYNTPGGPDITHLAKNMNLDCQFADRASIERLGLQQHGPQ